MSRGHGASRRRLLGAALAVIVTGAGPGGCTTGDDAPLTPSGSEAGAATGDGTGGARGGGTGGGTGLAEETMSDETMAEQRMTDESDAGPTDALPVTLRVDAPRSAATEPLELVVTLRNGTDREAALLLWSTPFEPELSADLFDVTRDGETLRYRGRQLKRATPPDADDIVRLAPGEALERVVELSRYYALDRPGTYRIRFTPRPLLVTLPADVSPLPLVAADASGVTVERY